MHVCDDMMLCEIILHDARHYYVYRMCIHADGRYSYSFIIMLRIEAAIMALRTHVAATCIYVYT